MRILIILIALILLLAVSQGSGEVAKKDIVDKKVYEKLSQQKEAKVFIYFKDIGNESDNNFFVSSLNQKENKNRKIIQQEVADALGKRIKRQFNGFLSANLTREEIDKFGKDPRIAKIELVGIRKVFLQDSVLLVNSTRTRPLQTTGINLTGIGQSICIIDTGVNYTHSDLGGCFGNNNVSSACKVVGGYDYVNNDANPLDDQGHGTHVAGIAAANGTINGVASQARIIAMKVCDSSGSCSDDDIIPAIDACVGNSSIYNISVISMSLGAGAYNTTCNGDSLASSINSAVAKNISVVVSAGNNNSATHISSPACVENATAVGGTDKSDALASFSRNSFVWLMAPGVSINSTMIPNPTGSILSVCGTGKSYCEVSGTSMAAPHVAGAIAILKEYIGLTNRTRTSLQIKTALNNTGKKITDSTGINYTRINIYQAIISLDSFVPAVNLISPSNNSVSILNNQTFRCNSSDLALRNMSFYLWNSSGGLVNQTSGIVSGASITFEANISNMSFGDYQWNCLAGDENNNYDLASANFSLSITTVQSTLNSPSNNLITNRNQTFSCNASSNNFLSNVTFYLWNSSGVETSILKNISGTNNQTLFNYNFTYEGNYSWNCLFVNNLSMVSLATNNYSVYYDLTMPWLNVSSPINNSLNNAGRLNVSINENGSCQYSFNKGIMNYSMSSINNRNFNATNSTLVQDAFYNVTYYCNDSAGNSNASGLFSFSVDLTSPIVNLLSPIEGYGETASSTTVNFIYNFSDNLNVSSCSLILNGAVQDSNSSISNQSSNYTITQIINSGSYIWSVNCTDQAGNVGNSSGRSLTISAPSSEILNSGGGGSSGGGGVISQAEIFIPTKEEIVKGYSRLLKKEDRIIIVITDGKEEKHNITLDNIGNNFVNVSIWSNPIRLSLNVGEQKKVNVSSAEYYDLLLKLESILSGKANLTVKSIYEPIKKINSGLITGSAVRDESLSQTETVEEIKEQRKDLETEIVVMIIAGSIGFFSAIILSLLKIREIRLKLRKKN